jgi:hypothetical protein
VGGDELLIVFEICTGLLAVSINLDNGDIVPICYLFNLEGMDLSKILSGNGKNTGNY